MRLASSIQEGGCTTSPRIPVTRLHEPDILPTLALLSPAFVVAAAWVAGKILGTGVEAVSVTIRVALLALAIALVVSAVAWWRATDRDGRVLSVVGLAGNALVLALGVSYLWLR